MRGEKVVFSKLVRFNVPKPLAFRMVTLSILSTKGAIQSPLLTTAGRPGGSRVGVSWVHASELHPCLPEESKYLLFSGHYISSL